MGQRFLNNNGAVLRYANESVYPFYILHYPVNMLAGYLLRPWNATVSVKYAVIVVLTTTVSLALHPRRYRDEPWGLRAHAWREGPAVLLWQLGGSGGGLVAALGRLKGRRNGKSND